MVAGWPIVWSTFKRATVITGKCIVFRSVEVLRPVTPAINKPLFMLLWVVPFYREFDFFFNVRSLIGALFLGCWKPRRLIAILKKVQF